MSNDITRSNIRLTMVVSLIVSTILTTVSVTSVYFALTNKLALMEQKQDTIIAQLDITLKEFKEEKKDQDQKYTTMETRLGIYSNSLTALESIVGRLK